MWDASAAVRSAGSASSASNPLSTIGSQAEPTPGNSTLTEFTLAAEGEGTRVAVVESGFDALDVDAAERTAALASHTSGWGAELDDLVTYAVGVTAER